MDRGITRWRLRSAQDLARLRELDHARVRPADTIYGCLSAVAAQHPTATAIAQVEPPDLRAPRRVLSYGQLVSDIAAASHLFRGAAGSRDSVVGVLLPTGPDGLVAFFAAQAAGIAVPLNPFLDLGAIAGILATARATTLVTTAALLAAQGTDADGLRTQVPGLQRILTTDVAGSADDFTAALDQYRACRADPDLSTDPQRVCVVMPTGGTTGSPKLVQLSQGAQLTVAWNAGALMGCEADGVVAQGMPSFHTGGSNTLALRALLYGMTLLILTEEGFRSRWVLEHFWQIVEHYRVTSVLATPTTALALLSGKSEPASGHALADFHVGGATVPMELITGFHRRFGIWLRESWGTTEVHGTVTGHPNDGQSPVVGSAGLPIPPCVVRAVILDERNHYVRSCGPDEEGALVVGGSTVGRGYADPEQNADFFVTGMPEGGIWANTGDLGRVDSEGYVWVSGRAKDVIIRGGHNIDPKAIEEVLAGHGAVELAAAVGRPDRLRGEMPVAYVQLKPGFEVTEGELLQLCRDRIHERAAVPVAVTRLEQMPLTPVGKIFKPALRRLCLDAEMTNALTEVLGPGATATTRVDTAGPRRRVVLEVPSSLLTSSVSQALSARLSGYGFVVEVEPARSM